VIAPTAGIVRVTLFDYSRQPPEPLAERLVYRRPQHELQVRWQNLSPQYSVGETVRGQVVTTDEVGQPISGVLGISALDDAVLQLAGRPAPRLNTQFMLLADIDRPEQLEDVNFYLSADPQAAVALDLLLGTQGWRRFARIAANRLAGELKNREELALGAAGGFGANVRGGALAEGAARSIAEAGGSGAVADVMDDAPRRFDNRTTVESLQEEQAGQQLQYSQPAPVVQHAEPRSWIAALAFGLLVIVAASAYVRRHPTRHAAARRWFGRRGAGCFTAGALLDWGGDWQGSRQPAAIRHGGIRRGGRLGGTTVRASGSSGSEEHCDSGAA
jgi:hypothetical protein